MITACLLCAWHCSWWSGPLVISHSALQKGTACLQTTKHNIWDPTARKSPDAGLPLTVSNLQGQEESPGCQGSGRDDQVLCQGRGWTRCPQIVHAPTSVTQLLLDLLALCQTALHKEFWGLFYFVFKDYLLSFRLGRRLVRGFLTLRQGLTYGKSLDLVPPHLFSPEDRENKIGNSLHSYPFIYSKQFIYNRSLGIHFLFLMVVATVDQTVIAVSRRKSAEHV